MPSEHPESTLRCLLQVKFPTRTAKERRWTLISLRVHWRSFAWSAVRQTGSSSFPTPVRVYHVFALQEKNSAILRDLLDESAASTARVGLGEIMALLE